MSGLLAALAGSISAIITAYYTWRAKREHELTNREGIYAREMEKTLVRLQTLTDERDQLKMQVQELSIQVIKLKNIVSDLERRLAKYEDKL